MQSAKKTKWWLTPLILLAAIILLHLFALQSKWVEEIYSNHIYPVVSSVLRILTGWLPFSLGDVLYTVVFVWILFKTIIFFFRKPTWKKIFFAIRNLLLKCLWVYVFFLLMWGLNYYRYGIGYKLQLIPDMYNTKDLKIVTAQLRDKLNANRKLMDSLHINYADEKTTFKQAVDFYNTAKTEYPYLNYHHADIKELLWSNVGNYSGFLGYYNPFTGEAQVNTKVPLFIIPFTACHEMAHQLGFASESEASFVGYLVVRSNNSTVFNYSAFFDLFGFANSELYSRDSVAAKQNVQLLDTLVKKDIAEYKQYLKDYRNPVAPLLSKLYGNYLKAHNQPAGIESYDEVVAWVVAYYKKYGTL
jgi:hypothetical protein